MNKKEFVNFCTGFGYDGQASRIFSILYTADPPRLTREGLFNSPPYPDQPLDARSQESLNTRSLDV